MPAERSGSEHLAALRLRKGAERPSGLRQTTCLHLRRSRAPLQMLVDDGGNFNFRKSPGSHFLFVVSRSINATSVPFFTSFASRSTSQLVRRTQPCDSDLLTFDGFGVP